MRRHSPWRRNWRALTHNLLSYGLGKRQLEADLPWLDARLRVYARDTHGRHLYKGGIHEGSVTQVILRYLQSAPQDVILDVGANLGYYSVLFDRATGGNAEIHAFEAEPRNGELCRHNLDSNGVRSVHLHHLAVADGPGVAELFLYKESNLGKHSLLPQDGSATVQVATVALDDFWRDHQFDNRIPTFIKIDIEGGEHRAMAGARRVLGRCPVVVSEFSQKFLRRADIPPDEHFDLMRGLGFAPYIIGRDAVLSPWDGVALPGAEGSDNVAWVRPEAVASPWWAAFAG